MKFLLLLVTFLTLSANQNDDTALKKQIGRMLIVGFENETIDKNSKIVQKIKQYDLGGVILFDRFYNDRNKTKNIRSPKQLQELTSKLKAFSNKPLLISVDQEGGNVARLKPKYGFVKTPSALNVSKMTFPHAKSIYVKQARMLQYSGINCNFAPVVDLALNPKNKVIYQLERSYGAKSEDVLKYAKILIDAQKEHHVISVLKHFPGHGSSLDDSHKGFVDITNTWSQKELEPYKSLIDSGDVDMIMTAHVFNKNLDEKYPATLSYNVNTKLLRQQLGFSGVIVSDDMQMKAISTLYPLKEALTLAINGGVDMLLFGNQLSRNEVDNLVNIIYEQVQNGQIPHAMILEANKRIENLLTKYSIVQKPIVFQQERINMTKKYIQEHYNLDVKDITINPKMIVLHWTAVMGFKDSFERLKSQYLFTDRKDIASAGALNVSVHFLIDRDGTIYRLMPDTWMARHVIGLNYSSIGIENVGGEDNIKDDLTPAQLQANIKLVKYLKAKYPSIKYLIGHHEYMGFEKSPLWLEQDKSYRTEKVDPGKRFMSDVRAQVKELHLKASYE